MLGTPKSVNVQGKARTANLPVEVRAVLHSFCNGSLAAGQLSEALSRAWTSGRQPEPRPLARSQRPLPTEKYATAN